MTSKVASGKHVLRRLADEGAEGGDAFEVQVVLGGGGGVASHVDVGPYIDSGGVAGAGEGGDALCGSCEEKAATTADVEDLLVAAPRVKAEHEIAMAEFSDLDVKQKEEAFGDEEAGGPEECL